MRARVIDGAYFADNDLCNLSLSHELHGISQPEQATVPDRLRHTGAMNGPRRSAAAAVGIGMAAGLAVAVARLVIGRRRPTRRGASRRQARRNRARALIQARADAQWVGANVDATRQLLADSAHASVHLADRDNARRSGDAYLRMYAVTQSALADETRGGARADRLEALRHKAHDIEREIFSYRRKATTAEAELAPLQDALTAQLMDLRRDAPAEVGAVATRLVAAHDEARRGQEDGLGTVDEALVQHRLEQVTTLRDELDQILGGLGRPPA